MSEEALRRALTELMDALDHGGHSTRYFTARSNARAALSEGQAPEPSEHERLLAGALMAVLQRVGVLVSSHGATGPELILAAETFCAAKQAPEPVAQEPDAWLLSRDGLVECATIIRKTAEHCRDERGYTLTPLYAGMDAARAKAIVSAAEAYVNFQPEVIDCSEDLTRYDQAYADLEAAVSLATKGAGS